MDKTKIVSIEERIPMLKQQRKKKANRRLVILLSLFFVLILCIIYFQSPLSKVREVKVSGHVSYSDEEIIRASEITRDMNIWKIDKGDTARNLKKLPEIKGVKIKIIFPNSVTIKLSEHKKLAYISRGKSFYPVLENGKVVQEREADNIPANAPVLMRFKEGRPLDEMISSLGKLPPEILGSISEIQHNPSKSDRYRIVLFMNNGFEVHATLRSFSKKMAHYPAIIGQLNPEEKGVIDLEVGSYFTSYRKEKADQANVKKQQQ
ncbi:cell division protein FtsQ/DivIB [Bacillus massilinigeriensis]|uniref:cell division protein FtsQ/DivIB n=1 Tax=Bacillus mediterraneensis TaxID=1805474 RepID=UPI0008F929B7|nr:cell division protein FtsQ/DivIB [Bacillus mediterraneensis]